RRHQRAGPRALAPGLGAARQLRSAGGARSRDRRRLRAGWRRDELIVAEPAHFLSIAALGAGYRELSLSPVAVTRQALDRIARLDGTLNSFITVCEAESLAQAAAAERELAAGRDRGALHGVP